MKCKKAQNLYLSYIDDDLSESDNIQFQNHLSHCVGCSKKAEALSEIYQPKNCIQRIKPSPYLWQNLYVKISENEYKADTFLFSENLLHYAINFGTVVIFVLSILFGIYLGSSPNLANIERAVETSDVIVSDEFESDSYITTFDDLPRESIGGVYLTMEME